MAGLCVFGTICSTLTAMFLLYPVDDKVKEALFEPSTMSGLYVPVGIVGWDFGFSLNDASGALH